MFDKDDYIAFAQRVKAHKYYLYGVAFVRASAQYAIYAGMAALAVPNLRADFHSVAAGAIAYANYFSIALELILLGLMLNSVLLTFSIYYRADREAFLNTYTQDTYNAKEERKRLLHSRLFWLEWGVLCLWFLVVSPIYGYSRIFELIPFFNSDLHPLLQRLLLTVVFGVATFFIMLYDRLDARNYWFELPGRLMKHRVWMSMSQKKEKKYGIGSFFLRLFGYALLYLLALPMVTTVVAVLISMFGIFALIVITPVLFVPILLVIAWFYLRALRYRRKFLKKLKKLCKEQGFELFDCKHPYRSVFRDGKGYTFGVSAHGKNYYCRLLASVRRSNRLTIDEDGTYMRNVGIIRTFEPRIAMTGGFAQAAKPVKDEDRDVLSYTSTVDYHFEADGEKVLILNPVPKRVLRKMQNTTREVDNGDRIGGYLVYTGNAFIRSLQADCIGKIDRKDPYKWI
ncbi:MAG: hypothetical protein IJF33_03405 [Clostridia bacterium]|nr:hypothetical protein [Clostridia bacterium]